MRKRDELSDPSSCLNKARDGEMLFVLLGRDPAFAVAVHAWINERIRLGLNHPADGKIQSAEECIYIAQIIDGGKACDSTISTPA